MRPRSSLVSAVIWAWVLFKALPFLLCFGVALLFFLLERHPPN